MTLPEPECAFFYAALAQLEPTLRPVFAERVAAILGALRRDPGPGDCDRAVRAALIGLWVPPLETEHGPRHDRRKVGEAIGRERNGAR